MLLSRHQAVSAVGWLSVLVVLPGLGGALPAAEPAGEPAANLLLLPPKVHVSPEYPVQIVVLLQLADGTLRDCTHDTATTFQVEPGSGLSVSRAGILSGTTASDSRLIVRYQQWQASAAVSSAAATEDPPEFAREIAGILGKAGCNQGTCHGNLHGKGGLRLSLRGDDPYLDYAALVRDAGGRRIDAYSPELSLLLRKTSGQLAHQGGMRFNRESQSYRWFRHWIDAGCPWDAEHREPPIASDTSAESAASATKLVRLRVWPETALLAAQQRSQQLTVQAEFADGSFRDVTRWTRFEPSLVTGVAVSEAGLVTVEDAMDVSISVSYLSGRSAARLTFLPARHRPWRESPPPSRLDALVEQQLQQMRIAPMSSADDSTFLRRAYLKIAGRLPTADEARSFLADQSPNKRGRLVEGLLLSPGYALRWALHWSDLLRNEQKVMSSQGAQQWYDWFATNAGADRPLDELVFELLTSVGSTYETPPASFHRTHREPELAAETIGQVFLGVRLQCARCHNHPFDSWRQDDYYGLAAYFTTIERKQVDNQPRDKFDKHIISGDELISLKDEPARIFHPGRATNVPPKPLTARQFDATQTGAATISPLESLAAWLTQDNRMFARNMANRIWHHYMGRGIVDPPDDFRDSNPPSNPELLEYLTDELVASDYSVRHVSRLILQSRTFARTAWPSLADDSGVLDGEAMFAGYALRRMSAEVLYDAIEDVAGAAGPPAGKGAKAVGHQRAIAQADTPTQANFLTAFGKPSRLLVCECERSNEVSLSQSLLLVNGGQLRQQLSQPENRLGQLLDSQLPPGEIIEELYLTAVARRPTTAESQPLLAYIERAENRRAAIEDVLWALLNSKEFLLVR